MYLLMHTHRHGVDNFFFRCDLPYAEIEAEDAAKALDVDYEADRDDEWLDLTWIDESKDIATITKADLEHAATLVAQVTCPQCTGTDEFCPYCDGKGKVTQNHAEEWHRQNDEEVSR